MMKKSLALALVALSSYGVLTSGCLVPLNNDMPDSVELTAELQDMFGNSVSAYFDYYLDVVFYDGTVISYFNQDAASDIFGKWSKQSSNLSFYTTTGGTNCYNTCVASDEFGCYRYATDCYNSSYTQSLNVSDIDYAQATIGIQDAFSYVVIPSSFQRASYASSLTTYRQSDLFVTPFLFSGIRPMGVKTQAMGTDSKNASLVRVVDAKLKNVTSASGKTIAGMKVRTAKPEIVTDLSKLSAEEMSRVIAARKSLHIAPASAK